MEELVEGRINRAEQLLRDTHLTYKEIGEMLEMSKQRVGQIARASGIRYKGDEYQRYARIRRGNIKLAKRLSHKLEKAAKRKKIVDKIKDMADSGLSFCSIAKQMDKPSSHIVRIARLNGIKSQHYSRNPKYRQMIK